MQELAYSKWHRTLGYSYFAMDLDNIEVRQNGVVGLIESSTTSSRHPDHKDVFNRFLSETGGFQFEVIYWISRWLGVPAFVVSMNPVERQKRHEYFVAPDRIQILNVLTAEVHNVASLDDFQNFICELPGKGDGTNSQDYDLPQLLEKLEENFHGIKNYPYFDKNRRPNWIKDYEKRVNEIMSGTARPPHNVPIVNQSTSLKQVKGETTGERKNDYATIRSVVKCPRDIDLSYFTIDWIEWRKETKSQNIGRPAAIIKTVSFEQSASLDFTKEANRTFKEFHDSLKYHWYSIVAASMKVKLYFCAYETVSTSQSNGMLEEHIGDKFIVIDPGALKKFEYEQNQYESWIKSI